MLRSTETYLSAVGPMTVERTWYRAGHEPAVVALEVRAGIIAGHWTPLAARQASVLVARMTPQECADTLRELGNMSPSKSTLDRLPKHLSSRWEEHREAFEEALRADAVTVPAEARTLAVSLDGVMAPMKDGQRQAKRAAAQAAGRATKGPAGYREVGCGTVSCYDGDGQRLNTLRIGRMPEANKATLKQMLSAEVEAVLRQRPDLEVVKLADGAHNNWSYLDELAPQAQCSERLIDSSTPKRLQSTLTSRLRKRLLPVARRDLEKYHERLQQEIKNREIHAAAYDKAIQDLKQHGRRFARADSAQDRYADGQDGRQDSDLTSARRRENQ